MLKRLTSLAALVTALSCGGDKEELQPCQSDAECKGERICERGYCEGSEGENNGPIPNHSNPLLGHWLSYKTIRSDGRVIDLYHDGNIFTTTEYEIGHADDAPIIERTNGVVFIIESCASGTFFMEIEELPAYGGRKCDDGSISYATVSGNYLTTTPIINGIDGTTGELHNYPLPGTPHEWEYTLEGEILTTPGFFDNTYDQYLRGTIDYSMCFEDLCMQADRYCRNNPCPPQ